MIKNRFSQLFISVSDGKFYDSLSKNAAKTLINSIKSLFSSDSV